MKTPLLGASYLVRSVNAAADRCVNLYPESVPHGGKETGFLNRCPGSVLLERVGPGPIRGLWKMNGYCYIVSGTELWRADTDWALTFLGAIAGTGPVSIADNGTQIFFAANPNGYIYNATTNVFAQITDPDFPGAVTVMYLNGFFLFNEPDSQKLWQTALLDGTSIDPTEFASVELNPDLLIAVIADHGEGWCFGSNSVQVYYASGGQDFAFSPIQGAYIETGCAAPYSVAKMDNSVFWLAQDDRGNGMVYRANGYTPQIISTHALSYAIGQYGSIANAIGFTYQQEAHSFYVLTFPTGNATWVYDTTTGLWHERAYMNQNTGALGRIRANAYAFFNGQHVIGDYENGNLYALSLDTYTDNGDYQKWLRAWRALPTGGNNLNRTFHHALQLDCQAGVGLDGTGQGTNPQVMLRWSDDGGQNWSNEHWRSMGAIGATGTRVIWRRLGSTERLRDRVYEVSGTDPVKIALIGADLRMSAGAS